MTRPLWVDPELQTYPAVSGDLEVDVAIVGGGLTGIGAAWALRESGLRVALLEERTLGSGASGRNGGFVLAGPAMVFSDAVATLGPEDATALWQFTAGNNREMAAIVRRHAIDCGFLRRGSMSLAISREEMDLLVRCHDALASRGISTALAAAADLPVPFDRMYAGGLYYPGNGEMNSGEFVRGVGAVLAEAISLHERTPVRGMSRRDGWELHTDGGVIRADAVVLATNAYTNRLLPEVPIAPTRGQVLATTPLPRVIVPFPLYANYGYQYWRQTVDGRLVVGGWRDEDIEGEVGMQERHHDLIQQRLLDFARTIAGSEVAVEYRWSGIMGFTPDGFPLVGQVPGRPGLFMSCGYSGHGVSMAFTCGGLAARAAIGETPAIPTAFRPVRFLSEAV